MVVTKGLGTPATVLKDFFATDKDVQKFADALNEYADEGTFWVNDRQFYTFINAANAGEENAVTYSAMADRTRDLLEIERERAQKAKQSADKKDQVISIQRPFPQGALRSHMALDTEKRAVLTAAALAHLVDLKKLTLDDPAGKEIVEFLEKLVTNGSDTDRDEILESFEKDGSFDGFLAQKMPGRNA